MYLLLTVNLGETKKTCPNILWDQSQRYLIGKTLNFSWPFLLCAVFFVSQDVLSSLRIFAAQLSLHLRLLVCFFINFLHLPQLFLWPRPSILFTIRGSSSKGFCPVILSHPFCNTILVTFPYPLSIFHTSPKNSFFSLNFAHQTIFRRRTFTF